MFLKEQIKTYFLNNSEFKNSDLFKSLIQDMLHEPVVCIRHLKDIFAFGKESF